MAQKTRSQKSVNLATDSILEGMSYNRYKKESIKQNIKGIRKENYYFIRDELQGKKISLEKLEKIEKYKNIREKIYEKKEKQYKEYSIEIIGYCSVYQHFPDGTKKFKRNEIISGKCQDNYKDAKRLFLENFNNKKILIWESRREILELNATIKKEWCI